MNLYIAAHVHHIEGLAPAESEALVAKWLALVKRRKNVLSMECENGGDLVVCNNACVLHRAVPMGEGAGRWRWRWRKDIMRVMVHDGSAWA
jgi:alpha-ketoglutarate-dependent 2,4-dichlorophenoxyacetate dioxygenase